MPYDTRLSPSDQIDVYYCIQSYCIITIKLNISMWELNLRINIVINLLGTQLI